MTTETRDCDTVNGSVISIFTTMERSEAVEVGIDDGRALMRDFPWIFLLRGNWKNALLKIILETSRWVVKAGSGHLTRDL